MNYNRKTPTARDIEEVFAALDAAKFPEDFLSEADRDRRPPEDRPELNLAIGPTTKAAMEDCRTGRVDPVTLDELRAELTVPPPGGEK